MNSSLACLHTVYIVLCFPLGLNIKFTHLSSIFPLSKIICREAVKTSSITALKQARGFIRCWCRCPNWDWIQELSSRVFLLLTITYRPGHVLSQSTCKVHKIYSLWRRFCIFYYLSLFWIWLVFTCLMVLFDVGHETVTDLMVLCRKNITFVGINIFVFFNVW